MRELKFRAFHKDTKEIYSVDLISFKEGYIEFSDVLQPMLLEHVELMQSTGLKDKNGIEIFEGDVVDVGGGQKEAVKLRDRKSVSYGQGDCSFSLGLEIASGYGKGESIEVIGNIHENPELLK